MYSRIPMPRSEWTDENKSYAMCFFPWIGAVIGLLSYGVFRFSKWFDRNGGGNYSLFFVIFLILIPVFITGGIHLDGFLDTQDALSSWQTKERRLEILKDSHAGAFAIISCTVYFLMYIGVYSCLSVRSMEVIAYSFMLSRTLSGLSVVTFPQARKKGMVADFSESASTRITRMVLGIYLIVLCFLIPLTGGICGIGGMYMSMVTTSGVWVHNCVSGYGWLAVALVIFATWSPARGMLVALVFGGLTIMRMYINIPGLPAQIYDMFPYIATILVLVITSMRRSKEHAQPKSCGLNYFREER